MSGLPPSPASLLSDGDRGVPVEGTEEGTRKRLSAAALLRPDTNALALRICFHLIDVGSLEPPAEVDFSLRDWSTACSCLQRPCDVPGCGDL